MRGSAYLALWALAAWVFGVGLAAAAAERACTVEVRAGKHPRAAVPVMLRLPEAMAKAKAFELRPAGGGAPVPLQLAPGREPSLAWIIPDALPAGAVRKYRLRALEETLLPGEGGSAVVVSDDGKRLVARVGDRRVLAYNHAVVESPVAGAPYYRRSGHIHPVWSPEGTELTDDFCPDHPHQHGIMFAWTKSSWAGRKMDFWNQQAGLGTVEHVGVSACVSGPVFGQFTVTLRHVALKAPGGPTSVLDETWTAHVWRRAGAFLFDLESVQSCPTGEPLEVAEYHYGGFCLRGRRGWGKEGDFLTSEGKTRRDGNNTPARWCAVHGAVGEGHAGLAVLGHPSNFRSPQPVRLHPSMPYFSYTPMPLGAFRIEKGKPYVSRYRFVAFDGKPDAAALEALWNDYAQPAEARVVD